MIEGLIWSPKRLRITTRLMIEHLKRGHNLILLDQPLGALRELSNSVKVQVVLHSLQVFVYTILVTSLLFFFCVGLELPNPSEFTLNGFVGQVHCLIDDNNLLFAGIEKSGTRDGKGKQKKKTSKFHRVRLGDGCVEAFLDLKSANHDPDPSPNIKDYATSSGPNMESLPAHGVWRNGGGQKLLMTSKEPKK